MRNTSTFGVQFITRMNKVKDGLAPIYVRVTVDSKRIEISLKKWVTLADWNNVKGMAKGSRPEIKSLNRYLEEVRSRLLECYQDMQLNQRYITAEAIKDSFLGVDKDENTLCKLVEYHNTTLKNTLAKGTMKNYFTTQKYIRMFLKERYRTSDVYLSELSYQFITDLEFFLRSYEPKDHQRPLGNNGVMKHMERFRKIINLGLKLEWMTKDPFKNYRLKFQRVDHVFVTQEELSVIEGKKLDNVRLQLVRDLFVFSCYTGLSYIDVMALTKENIAVGMDGEYWLFTHRQKTDTPVRVPILPKAWEIIEKYKENPRAVHNGTVFPVISNQKLNNYLRELADICRVNKKLTFHVARHTFATTVTLSNGVPIESVSKMMGHTKLATTQIYARVLEKKVSEDMGKLREKLGAHRKSKPALKTHVS